jgi:hypothetical protein
LSLDITLSKIHVFGTLFLFLFFAISYFNTLEINTIEKHYVVTNYPEDYSLKICLIIFSILLIQFLFIINIFATTIKYISVSLVKKIKP